MSILDKSREVIGDDELIKRAVEEMTELIVAIIHFDRHRGLRRSEKRLLT